MRTILIGDVHGCVDELALLLGACGANAAEDRIVLVGDLVAKGPASRAVVELAREWGALAVLGNHDDAVLRARSSGGTSKPHHIAVASSLGEAEVAWLAALPLWLHLPDIDVMVVHGGLVPGLSPEKHERRDLLNTRSLDAAGRPSPRIEGGVPWASRWRGPWHVVFGHDAIRGLQRYPLATGLDTGCVYGRTLTALLLPENRLVSVPARRNYISAPR